jgi:hypothetical protein
MELEQHASKLEAAMQTMAKFEHTHKDNESQKHPGTSVRLRHPITSVLGSVPRASAEPRISDSQSLSAFTAADIPPAGGPSGPWSPSSSKKDSVDPEGQVVTDTSRAWDAFVAHLQAEASHPETPCLQGASPPCPGDREWAKFRLPGMRNDIGYNSSISSSPPVSQKSNERVGVQLRLGPAGTGGEGACIYSFTL